MQESKGIQHCIIHVSLAHEADYYKADYPQRVADAKIVCRTMQVVGQSASQWLIVHHANDAIFVSERRGLIVLKPVQCTYIHVVSIL